MDSGTEIRNSTLFEVNSIFSENRETGGSSLELANTKIRFTLRKMGNCRCLLYF